MLCKNCGRELPISGQFCPFCGAPAEQVGVNDETMPFTPVSDDEPDLLDDIPTFDPSRRRPRSGAHDPLDDILDDPLFSDDPPRSSRQYASRQQQSSSRTTYFDPSDHYNEPYRRPSPAKKALRVILVLLVIGGLIGGGVWFFLNQKPDENLTLAEKYMQRGKFEDALTAFEAALSEAKDPAAIQLQIDQLKSYMQAQSLVESGQYNAALATLNDLHGRISDKTSPLAEAVDALIKKATAFQADTEFTDDLSNAESYLDDEKYDAAAGLLDTLADDDTLTDEQQRQVQKLQDQLQQAQETAQRQEENQQQQEEQKQSFNDQISQLESNDRQIAEAATTEDALNATATSFEAWDSLLNNMYDYLSTVLNADQYAAEEESYNEWVQERDSGAANAAQSSEDEVAGQLASASFKQSYTKTRCYKLLDLIG